VRWVAPNCIGEYSHSGHPPLLATSIRSLK
jgi:hypothetical protein